MTVHATPTLTGFQDSASPIMERLVDLHNTIFFYLVLILVIVMWLLGYIVYDFYYKIHFPFIHYISWTNRIQLSWNRRVSHGERIEIFWTLVPSYILVLIAVPSFYLLFSMEEVLNPSITFKAIGHQWYWSYEYSDYAAQGYKLSFDSNMVYEEELTIGDFRLLQVDNPIILPVDTHIRVIVTSFDVLHSWAVPSLGIKIDGAPGRLNQGFIYLKREGVFYGQCSELCGVNHGFMPILIKSTDANSYLDWVGVPSKHDTDPTPQQLGFFPNLNDHENTETWTVNIDQPVYAHNTHEFNPGDACHQGDSQPARGMNDQAKTGNSGGSNTESTDAELQRRIAEAKAAGDQVIMGIQRLLAAGATPQEIIDYIHKSIDNYVAIGLMTEETASEQHAKVEAEVKERYDLWKKIVADELAQMKAERAEKLAQMRAERLKKR